MRAILRAASAALFLSVAAAGSASAQGVKLAYIRSSVLLEQAPGRAEAEAQFDKETAGYREQISKSQDSLQQAITAFQKVQASLSAATRDARTKDLQGREAKLQQLQADLQQKAQARQAELVQPILDRVKAAIEDVRVEGGYSFVFNNDQGSPIVAADKNLDITDRVLAKLRAAGTRPATTAPAAAPAGVTRPTTPPLD